jgi:hypothetical protein
LLPEADLLLTNANPIERLWSTKEGVGETSGQTAGSYFSRARSLQNRSGRRNRFSSFGADLLELRNFTGVQSSKVKSGPDVFADALVPAARAIGAGALIFPNPF